MGDPAMCSRFGTIGHYGQITLKSDQESAIVDVLKGIANLRGAPRTLSEQSTVADSQPNGFSEHGIRSVEEAKRVILFDLSNRVGSPISVHSPVFPWIVDHATDILNKCHVARVEETSTSRGALAIGAAVMFKVAGKVPGGVMTERWHLGTWLGKRFHTEEHIVARKEMAL